jgi:hypothetical protein
MTLSWLTTALGRSLRIPPSNRRKPCVVGPILEYLEDRMLPSFNGVIDYPVGLQPHGIAVGDFNGDGKPDLATANFYFNPSSVSVLLGNGDGTFQPAVNYAVGSAPEDVKTADFNGDGKLDLAVASSGNNSASILLGNGNGTFQAPVNYPAGTKPYRLALGDFNGDGKPDIAVADEGNYRANGAVTILLGNGNGTFLTGASYTTGPTAVGIAVGDLNGDGKQDLVATAAGTAQQGTGNAVFILLGNGNGTFQAPSHFTYATGASPDGVAVADFNGDGKADLAIANYYGNSMSVLLGNGNGTFGSPTSYAVGSSPFPLYTPNVTVADLNQDGKADLVVTDAGDGNAWVFLGNGNGTFQPGVNYAAGGGTQSVGVGDFNGDGKPDVATANIGANSVTVLLGNGNGTFPALPQVVTGAEPSGVAAADFNGDGKLDMVTANYASSTMSVLLGNGNGTFQPAVNTATAAGPQAIAVGDFNNDGKPDVATANYMGNSVSVLIGNGDGTFKSAVNYAIDGIGEAVAVGDFRGDGKVDLVTADSSANMVSLLLGNGNGTFQAAVNLPVGTTPIALAVADVNGDGKLDVATANQGSNGVSLLLGNGNGTFQAPINVAAGTKPSSLAVADVNGDGKLDLAVTDVGSFGNNSGAGVSVLLGNGNGTFQPAVLYPAARQPWVVAVADLNGDGRPDLAIDNLHGDEASILLGNGNGTFQPPVDYVAGASPDGMTIGDFNGDRAPDLAFANGLGNTVSLLVNLPAIASVQVNAAASTTAGFPLSVTVTALSVFGGPVYAYTGMVHFSSSDVQAGLPADYTFTAGDAGVHTFSNGIVLKTSGSQTITATDTATSALTGTAVLPVSAAAAAQLTVAAPSGSTTGSAFTVTVTALDAYGNIATGYTGTIHFSSSDQLAGLPVDYTFSAADAGVHTFMNMVTLSTAGSQTVTATDTSTPWIGTGGTLGGGQTITAHHKTSAFISGTATVVVSSAARWPDKDGWAVLVDAYFAGSGFRPGAVTRLRLCGDWERVMEWDKADMVSDI